MVAPKAPVSLHSRTPRTLVTPSTSLTALTGKAACWRFVKTDLLAHPVAVTKVVEDSEAPRAVEDFEGALAVLALASEAMADAVATKVEEVAMEARLPEASMTALLQALLLLHRTLLRTTLHLGEK